MTKPEKPDPQPVQHRPQYPRYDSIPVSEPLSREEMPGGWGASDGQR